VLVAVLDREVSGSEGDLTVPCDVSVAPQVEEAIRRVASEFGGLDHVVNAAGVGAQGTIESATDEEWWRVLDVNLLGAVRVCRAAIPLLRASSCPAIVNVCSIAATAGLPERAVYGASKGALLALTLHMAADGMADGIRVNAVNPGTADTPWVDRLLSRANDPVAERLALEKRQPHGRLVAAAEIADAIAYLVDPRAGSTTGTALAVDGGMAGLRLRPA
jgi:NAD(P)-dependent dehydrogenase (short-subunit alcohol dehydrogenase family)